MFLLTPKQLDRMGKNLLWTPLGSLGVTLAKKNRVF